MATMTTTQTATTPPSSPRRKTFGISMSPKAVVSRITAPKRFASTPDFGRSTPSSPRRQSTAPAQQQQSQNRVVSTPARNGKQVEGREGSMTSSGAQAGNGERDVAASVTSASTSRSLSFPHVANIFIKMRRARDRARASHITSSSGDAPKTHPSLAVVPVPVVIAPPEPDAEPSSPSQPGRSSHLSADDASVDLDVPKKHARFELRDNFVCADGVDVKKLLRASRMTLLEHAQLFRANVLTDEEYVLIFSLFPLCKFTW